MLVPLASNHSFLITLSEGSIGNEFNLLTWFLFTNFQTNFKVFDATVVDDIQ